MYVWTLAAGLFLLALGGILADGGALFLRHADALRLASGAAHAGAMQLDVARLRASPEACPRLDPVAARAAAERYLAGNRDIAVAVEVTPDAVPVEVRSTVRPALLNLFGARSLDVRERAVARPRAGTDSLRGECRS